MVDLFRLGVGALVIGNLAVALVALAVLVAAPRCARRAAARYARRQARERLARVRAKVREGRVSIEGGRRHTMKKVVIESPLRAPTREGIERNKHYARRAMLDSLGRGEAPYASHLLFDQPGLLDDLNTDERELGIVAGLAWGEAADLVAVYIDRGITEGMQISIRLAKRRGQPIEYRRLDAAAACGKHCETGRGGRLAK